MNELTLRIVVVAICIVVLALVIAVNLLGHDSEENIPVDGTYAEYEETTVSAETLPDITETEPPETVSETEEVTSETTVSETSVPEDAVPEETTATSASRTIITSRVRKDYDNNSVYIDMENILQLPELPVGCEITALTILLRHCGFNAEKTDLAKNYLPTSWGNARYEGDKTYKDSFFDYFIGDPFGRGYGCFSGAIEKAANAYIADHGGGFTVKNISGSHPDVLYDYLAAGTPVLCWATDGMIEPEYYETWYDNVTGEQLDWYLNEHCFVLAGFNMSGDIVTLNDPMKGIIDYNINKFETRYDQMHRQAIVILPNGSQEKAPAEGTETKATETEASETEITEEGSSEEYSEEIFYDEIFDND